MNSQSVALKLIRATRSALMFAAIYFCADYALNNFAFSGGWTILWPLNGVTIALLIMRPPGSWPAMLLGVVVGTGIGEYLDGNSIGEEVLQRLLSLMEVLISASLLPPFSDLKQWLCKPRLFRRFFAALLLGPGLSGILAAVLFHYAQGQSYLLAFNNWATSDALGIAATMPLALSVFSLDILTLFNSEKAVKKISVALLSIPIVGAVFFIHDYELLFTIYPLLILVEYTLSFSGLSLAMFGVCLVSVYSSTHSLGPFGQWPENLAVPRDLALQIYLGFHLVALFPAAIVSMERRKMAEDLRETNMRLAFLASVDGLTDIPNRRSLDNRFNQEWHRAVRSQTPLSFLMVDIDRFKQFNDLYGHPAGDQCLRVVAKTLREQLRRHDDLVARFGGEEFAFLLPHTANEGAITFAEQIRRAVFDANLRHEGTEWGRVTVSIGCSSMIPGPGDERSALLASADAMLYRAKQNGRNRVEVAAP
jgi:diguanylate cyclase (GGDEF)-like protein